MSARPAEAIGVAASSTRRPPPPGRAANAATYLPLPAALREPPQPPEGGHDRPADTEPAARISADVRRHGSRSRTARSARARRRPSASTKRLPAPLRPTTRRRQSFRGKGLRRAKPPTGLICRASHPAVRKQWPLSRLTTLPLYLAAPSGPDWLLRRTANGHFGGGERSAVTLARAGSMIRLQDPFRQLEKHDFGKFSVHKSR